MPTPDMIGRVRYTEPRAVNVREPGQVADIHSAIHSTLAIYTDTFIETNYLLENWTEVMQAVSDAVNSVLSRSPDSAPAG